MQNSQFPQSVARAWQEQFQVWHASPVVGSGLSSARVWRLSTTIGEIALKAWPGCGTSPERLANLQLYTDLARACGATCIPKVYPTDDRQAWSAAEGCYWQAAAWQPGQPDMSGKVVLSRRESAAKCIAAIHHCWGEYSTAVADPPGLSERLQRLRTAKGQLTELVNATFSADDRSSALGLRTVEHLRRSVDQLIQRCARMLRPVPLHFAIRDLHCEHVLYERDEVVGVIDFGAARMDDPLLDLVRLLASQSPYDRDARYETLTIYHEEKRRLRSERQKWPTGQVFWDASPRFGDFALLDQVSTLLSAVQWMNWMLVDSRQFEVPAEAVLDRWEGFLIRLDRDIW
jgi:aminoglycoside phosphotransferase (APT) family kinase protein